MILKKKCPQLNAVSHLNNIGQLGSHWVVFYVRNKKAIFIDSFGGCPSIEVWEYVNAHKLKLIC